MDSKTPSGVLCFNTSMKLKYPVSPVHFNQGFGASPEYYKKFHDQFGNEYKGHDGIDFMAVHGQPVYAPMDGEAHYQTDVHGGQGVVLTSSGPLEYDGGTCWFTIMLWHLVGDTDPKFPKPFEGYKNVKKGDLVGYADNTGAPYESSGDHLHFGLKPTDKNGKLLFPGNGFNGGIDGAKYFESDRDSIIRQLIALYQQLLKNRHPNGV